MEDFPIESTDEIFVSAFRSNHGRNVSSLLSAKEYSSW